MRNDLVHYHHILADLDPEDLERRMDEVVGQLSQEPSHIVPEANRVSTSSLDIQAPRLDYNNSVEHVATPQPDDLRLDHRTPYTATISPNITDQSLNNEIQDIWLQKYHPWFPILHHTSVVTSLSSTLPGHSLLQKAIMAATIWDISGMSPEQRNIESEKICQELILKAMASSNFPSLQALLILAMLSWGEGKWPQCTNLIAVSKR